MRTFLGATLAWVSLIVCAAAQEEPPAPATLDDAGVTAWIETYLDVEGWTLIGADGQAVAFGGPEGVAVLADGTLQARVRHEYYTPVQMGGQEVRSNLQTRILDCTNNRQRATSMSIFELSNMRGASQSREPNNAAWDTPRAGSLTERAFRRICEAPQTGQRQ